MKDKDRAVKTIATFQEACLRYAEKRLTMDEDAACLEMKGAEFALLAYIRELEGSKTKARGYLAAYCHITRPVACLL